MSTINGVTAADVLRGFKNLQHGMCLMYVWRAYDAAGAEVTRSAGDATGAWEKSDGKHRGDRNPPPGVPVWWGRRRSDGNAAGDVVISLGNGLVACTDYPAWGTVGVCTIDERERQINREYLGWTESIFDQPIQLPPQTAGNETAPEQVHESVEDEDMKLIRWDSTGAIYLISRGAISYVKTLQQYQDLAATYGAYKNLSNESLTTHLVHNGIPWAAVDACMKGVAYKEDGSAGGHFWSREMAEGIAGRLNDAGLAKSIDDLATTARQLLATTGADAASTITTGR